MDGNFVKKNILRYIQITHEISKNTKFKIIKYN